MQKLYIIKEEILLNPLSLIPILAIRINVRTYKIKLLI